MTNTLLNEVRENSMGVLNGRQVWILDKAFFKKLFGICSFYLLFKEKSFGLCRLVVVVINSQATVIPILKKFDLYSSAC